MDHHAAGLRALLADDDRHAIVLRALRAGRLEDAFEGRDLASLRCTELLTVSPHDVSEADVQTLRAAGLDDGEILEINQAAAYFAHANRTGLGITTDGDDLGTAPSESDDVTQWRPG